MIPLLIQSVFNIGYNGKEMSFVRFKKRPSGYFKALLVDMFIGLEN